MPIPLVALQVQPPNVVGAFAQGRADQQSNALRQLQMEDARSKMQRTNALADFYQQQGPGLAQGDPNALAGLARLDPAQAMSLRGSSLENDKRELDAAKTRLGLVASAISAVKNAPEGADKQALWNSVRGNLESQYGIPVTGSDAPEQWDETWADVTLNQTLTVKEQLDQSNNVRDFEERLRQASPKYKAEIAGAEAGARQPYELARVEAQQAGQLQEVYDPTSPTGTRLVRRAEALGQPGKPGSGLRLTTSPDGGIELVQGPGAGVGGSGLTRTTQTRVEDRILSAGDTRASLAAIDQKYKPEFQQLGTRWSNLVNSVREKAGFTLSEKESADLREFSQYKAEAGQLFALTLKELSGVAVNPTEFQRAQAWLPNPGTGLMDGDSPTELKAKIDRFTDFTNRALAKYTYIRKNGLDVNAIDVDQIPQIMQARGDQLAQEYQTRGLSGDALKNAVRDTLVDEFGLGAR